MSFSLSGISSALTDLSETGVSFEGKAISWATAENVQDLIDAINNCKKLEFLNLEGNTLGIEAAKCIGEALKSHPELKRALWKDLFTGRLKTEIPQALELLSRGMIAGGVRLTSLDCGDNALGPNGMKGLVELLKSPTCFSLQELKLNNCGLGIQGGKMLARALLDGHTESVKAGTPLSLKIFIAGRNRLENDGATALAEVFGTLKTLEEIAMPQNGIYHIGISALSKALMKNPNMTILNLNDNTIGPKGCQALVSAFEHMQKIKDVNFGDCLIKTPGAVYLSEILTEGHTDLEILNLGFNEIGSEGAQSICLAVRNKENLKSLVLNGNMFGSECREELKDSLVSYDRIDALGTLSEDDSDNDDDYDENDDSGEDSGEEGEEEEDENDEEDYETEGEEIENIETQLNLSTTLEQTINDSDIFSLNDSSVCITGEETLPNTIETFCTVPNPSLTLFEALEENDKITAFRDYLKTVPEEEYLTFLVYTVLKCSALSQKSKEANQVSDALFLDAFQFAKNNKQMTKVRNFFLIQLGLLKSEDKKFQPIYDINACRFAIQSAIKQKTFPEEATNTFSVFMERFKN